MDDLPIVSPTPEEDATLLVEPKEPQVTTTCLPWHEKQAPKLKDAAKLMETATESQGTQVCPLLSPGFELPPRGSEPPLLEEDDPLIRIPNPEEAHFVLKPICAINLIIFGNELMGDIKYEYETQFLEFLHPESPYPRPNITEL